MESESPLEYIWLEVSNVALSQIGTVIEVQLKADRETDRWLPLKDANETNDGLYKSLVEAMKDKRPIHARLAPAPAPDEGGKLCLVIEDLRVMFAANTRP